MKRKGIIVAATIVALLIAAVMGVELFLRHAIRGGIEQALEGTDATVEMGRISVSLPRRSVSVRDVRIRAQNNDPARRGSGVVSLDVALGNIALGGIGYDKVEGRPALSADRLAIERPRATLVTRNVGGTDSLPAAKNPLAALSEKLSSLTINEIAVRDAVLELVQWISDGESTRTALGGGELSVRDFTLDSLPADIGFTADSVIYGFGAGAKVLRADSVAFESAAGRLSLGRFALVPQFPKEEFAGRVKNHEDWTAITLEEVSCAGVDFPRLLSEKTLAIDSISLASADIASYKNRQIFQQPRQKQMLYQAVQRLPIPVDVRVLAFENLDIRYDELAEKGTTPGTVLLTGGRGTAANLTNIPEGHERFMTVDLDAMFMASGALKARFLFPVSAADDRWELYGRLGAADMTAFNRALEPLVNARITSGMIKSLDFHITGTLTEANSHLAMVYNDLKVELLDKRDHTRERKFLSFLVDDILVRSDNPGRDGRGRLREADGGHTRDPERSMWNYIWHSLLPAIVKTVV